MARRLADMYQVRVNPEWELTAGDFGTLSLTPRCQEVLTEIRNDDAYQRAIERLISLFVQTVARADVCKKAPHVWKLGAEVWKDGVRVRWCVNCGITETVT